MSDTPSPSSPASPARAPDPLPDPLIDALRELPTLEIADKASELRLQRHARAAYVRTFEDAPWHTRFFGTAGRAAVPLVLAGVVGVYLTWAVAAATSLVH